jgi:hypothetical protein
MNKKILLNSLSANKIHDNIKIKINILSELSVLQIKFKQLLEKQFNNMFIMLNSVFSKNNNDAIIKNKIEILKQGEFMLDFQTVGLPNNDLNTNSNNIKESRKIRSDKIAVKQYYHKKNPKSLAYYNNTKSDVPKETTTNLNKENEMKDKDTKTADSTKKHSKSRSQTYAEQKYKSNLQNISLSLGKIYKKDGIFLDFNNNQHTISVMKDFNHLTQIGKIKTSLSLRCIIGFFDLKESVLINNNNFGMIKNSFSKWLNTSIQGFKVEENFRNTLEPLLLKYSKNEYLVKYFANLESKLLAVLKKPTKQPHGFVEKIEQICNSWLEESNEIYYIEQIENQLNFKSYEQSFPLARSMKRKFSIFIGKTNSGKTYTAMNELAMAQSGSYLAPLRLMAQEGQESLFDRKILANLITGEEQKKFDGATHVSSTIEMCNMSKPVDVAVIDEIQMIADDSRGWAWSQALVGVPAKHVILVGSEESLPFIIPIIESLGEEYEIRKFERKTPLHIHESIWKLKDLKDGDCIVVFSRKSALEMKNSIEATGKKCSVIYGNLSPDVRRSEATKFKSGENPILVATDAIGMGLNLPISRLFFSTLEKFDGISTRYLNVSEIKQIAGRAGRYGFVDFGEVGILFNDSNADKTLLHKAIYGDYEEVHDTRVPIAPNLKQIETICNTIGKQDLYAALIFFKEKMVRNHKLYKTANLEDMIDIASMIKNKNLDLATGLNYACVPIDTNSDIHTKHFFKWMNNHINKKENLSPELPDVVELEKNDSYSLFEAENFVKLAMAYRWLHYKYPSAFHDIETVVARAQKTNIYIEKTLHHHIVMSKNPRWKR